MKISPLHGRGAGVGCPQSAGPTPEGCAFCPSQEGIFIGANEPGAEARHLIILYDSLPSLKEGPTESFQTNSISNFIQSVFTDPLNDQEVFYPSERWIIFAVIENPLGDHRANTGKCRQLCQCGSIDIYFLGCWSESLAAPFGWWWLRCQSRLVERYILD